MHPSIRKPGPGTCPICGMALEPESGGSDGDDAELRSMTWRFWTAVGLALPVVVLAMGDMLLPGHPIAERLGSLLARRLEFALTTLVVFVAGWPLLVRGVQSLARRTPNMFALITLGVGVAYGFSVVSLFVPSFFPEELQHQSEGTPLYFEAAAVIIALVLLGQVMELRARSRAGGAIRALLDLAPKTARLVEDGQERDVPLESIVKGAQIRIRPGEKVPVDGKVLEGRSSVDESMISGESMPIEKQAGAKVASGTVNGTGTLLVEATQVGSETLLARIVEMVSQAQRSRAPIQNLADRVSAWFVPSVLAIGVLAMIAWLLWGPEPRLVYAALALVSVLIIACPCALGLATPMSIMVATGRGAQEGVLFKNAEAIQTLREVDVLVVDKTGTLTLGQPKLDSIVVGEGSTEENVLALAAALERGSEHPLAQAILEAADERSAEVLEAQDFGSVTGKGITGTVGGQRIALGNRALMEAEGLSIEALASEAQAAQEAGATVVFLGQAGALVGALVVRDPVKPESSQAIQALKDLGLRVIMLTGDNERTAKAVAKELGLDEVVADALPEDKLQLVDRLQSEGLKVAMAGDGINDSPALAKADVGIAVGTGTDVAIESADLTLVGGNLEAIGKARILSEETMRNIRQNLVFAFAYNAAGVPLAAGVLYPFTGWLLNPMFAAAAMSLSSVSVIANALRLRSTPKHRPIQHRA